jgi:hypothetical protein
MASRNRITVDSLLSDLAEDRALARELGQPSAAISATALAAKLTGLLVDRKESGQPGDFSGMQSEADVLALVRNELGEDSAQALAAALAKADVAPVLDLNDVDPPVVDEADLVEPSHGGSGSA